MNRTEMTSEELLDVAQSMCDAMWCIVHMPIREHTDRDEVIELFKSSARLELEKCARVGLRPE